MSNNNKNFFIPEQLEDEDFEKEKIENKKRKKIKSFISNDERNVNKKVTKAKIKNIIGLIIFALVIVICAVIYVTPHEEKVSKPERLAKDFCAYFNSCNWKKVNNYLDLKGYYILGSILEESEYTKFDITYKKFEDDKKYEQYKDIMNKLLNIDEEILNSVANIRINLNRIESCNKIQGTDSLYKLRVNFDYVYDGQTENTTDVIFISDISGEYKMVFGEWIQTVLNYYQTVFMLQNNYNY